MGKKKSGYVAICRLEDSREVCVYLERIPAKALKFVWEESKISGCVYPYEVAHALNPKKYPLASLLPKDQFFRFKNGETYGMKMVSEVLNEFKRIIALKQAVESSRSKGLNDPFPFCIARNSEHDFTVITICVHTTQIDFIPFGDESKKE